MSYLRTRQLKQVHRIQKGASKSFATPEVLSAQSVGRLCEVMASLSAAGLGLPLIWRTLNAKRFEPTCTTVIALGALGANLGHYLRKIPRHIAPANWFLATALDLAQQAGAGAHLILLQIGKQIRLVEQAKQQQQTAYASAKATIRIIILLPVFSLGIGMLLGANPLQFLMFSTWGRVCLILATALFSLGFWWVIRLLKHSRWDLTTAEPAVLLSFLSCALGAGHSLAWSLDFVGTALCEPALNIAARNLKLGLKPRNALSPLLEIWPDSAALLLVAAEGGGDAAELLAIAANHELELKRQHSQAKSERLNVHLVLPTGLCFLPAFVAIGIIPTAASLLSTINWSL